MGDWLHQRKRKINTNIQQKERLFLNNSSSEHRNKPNRDENANRKKDDAWIEKRKENKTPNRGNHSQSRSRSETRNDKNRWDKSKSTERIVVAPRNNQKKSTISKTEANREKYDQTKRNIFLFFLGKLQKNLKPS